MRVNQYIQEIEASKDPIENPIEINNYINSHMKRMPQITGPKAFALSGMLRDQDDHEELCPPDSGISPDQLSESELAYKHYIPNFLRPFPVEEIENEFEEMEPIWLVPGMMPEPYWDLNMGQELSFHMIRQLIRNALKKPLSEEEQRKLVKALKTDPELISHIGMTPQKLPCLVINNQNVAYELLICMTNTMQITKYYDALSSMKLSPNTLEVFNKLSSQVELPQEYIQVFIKNCMNQCRNSNENKVSKNRMVRLVCVFLQSIIKSKIINLQDITVDVQAFCIEFSLIKEANTIFKNLQVEQFKNKGMDNPDT